MCWCAVKKLLTHSLVVAVSSPAFSISSVQLYCGAGKSSNPDAWGWVATLGQWVFHKVDLDLAWAERVCMTSITQLLPVPPCKLLCYWQLHRILIKLNKTIVTSHTAKQKSSSASNTRKHWKTDVIIITTTTTTSSSTNITQRRCQCLIAAG